MSARNNNNNNNNLQFNNHLAALGLVHAGRILRSNRNEISRLVAENNELNEKVLDKDDVIHDWWTKSQRQDRQLEEQERKIGEKEKEIAALKAELEEMKAAKEASVGGGEDGGRSHKRRRSQ